MASASQILFREAGLDTFGRPPGWWPPKPLSDEEISALGDELDRLEDERLHVDGDFCGVDRDRYVAWRRVQMALRESSDYYAGLSDEDYYAGTDPEDFYSETLHARHMAKLAYAEATWDRVAFLVRELEMSDRLINANEKIPLEIAAYHAMKHREMTEDCHPFITTDREVIDAYRAERLADKCCEIAAQKFKEQNRRGMVWRRVKAKPTRYVRDANGTKIPRSKS